MAIAHDYLTQLGGAEKVVLNMSKAFPEPRSTPCFTTLTRHFPNFRIWTFEFRRSTESVIAETPSRGVANSADRRALCFRRRRHRADEQQRLGPRIPHQWPQARLLPFAGALALPVREVSSATTGTPSREWGSCHVQLPQSMGPKAALNSDRYLANSTQIKRRIADVYGIDADVVFPPVTMSLAD